MTYSVNVINSSGASQSVAIFLADASDSSELSLVWLLKVINNNVNQSFTWDQSAYGLGWGSTPLPIDAGVQFTSGQAPTPVLPNTAGGNNALPIQYKNNGFFSGTPYANSTIYNKLEITTDTSFTVEDSLTMSVALYINAVPALALQGAPNTFYYFDIAQISYYLTVTNLAPGTALPKPNTQTYNTRQATQAYNTLSASMSTPTKIAFGSGATSLVYTLDSTLTFHQS